MRRDIPGNAESHHAAGVGEGGLEVGGLPRVVEEDGPGLDLAGVRQVLGWRFNRIYEIPLSTTYVKYTLKITLANFLYPEFRREKWPENRPH